jgi:hypothetical protein
LRTLSTFDDQDVSDVCGYALRRPYRKRVAIKRHEFLRKPNATVAECPVASRLEVSRTAVETSALSSSPSLFACGSARVVAPERANANPLLSVSNATLTTPYAVLLEAA